MTATRAHKTERVCLPRRLVPRRPSIYLTKLKTLIQNGPSSRFCVGDLLSVEDSEGYHNDIVVIGIAPDGHVDAMVWDGLPHYIATTVDNLARLRIIRVERMGQQDIEDYSTWMRMDAGQIEVAA